ncbi:hypothetical protein BTA51_29405 [Hahella sp. CCB-MM4]|nr:hypothetical protein BTA51_29405 [Hahella sp. CCB-MM4]
MTSQLWEVIRLGISEKELNSMKNIYFRKRMHAKDSLPVRISVYLNANHHSYYILSISCISAVVYTWRFALESLLY